tara:strand:- start:936 stop:1679 length:744 start_codon:yes stop_codon:yes gene_type:complete
MPTLTITKAEIKTKDLLPYTQAKIASIMSYSKDINKQSEAFDYFIPSLLEGQFEQGHLKPEDIPIYVWRDLLKTATNVRHAEQISKELNKRRRLGALFGTAFLNMIKAPHKDGEKLTIEKAVASAKDDLLKKSIKFGAGEKHLVNNLWPHFKPVIHLWGAYLELEKENRARGGTDCFPYWSNQFYKFFTMARELLKQGCLYEPLRPKGPLLNEKSAIEIALDHSCPIELEFTWNNKSDLQGYEAIKS